MEGGRERYLFRETDRWKEGWRERYKEKETDRSRER